MMWRRDHVRKLYKSERASTVSFVEEEHTIEKLRNVKNVRVRLLLEIRSRGGLPCFTYRR
jgi:hypothetical protein